MIEKLVCGTSTGGDVFGRIGSLIDRDAPTATGKLIKKMQDEVDDVRILISGDGTGDQDSEWAYQYSKWLGEKFPKYKVDYYRLAGTVYSSSVTIQAGTGSKVLRVYNCSVIASKPDHILGHRFDVAVRGVLNADLIIMNHGHVMMTDPATTENPTDLLVAAGASMLQEHPQAGLVFLTQNPRRGDDNFRTMYKSILDAASILNATVADSYQKFIAENKNPTYYLDNINPSALGTLLQVNALKDVTFSGSHLAANSSLDNLQQNLIINGNFSDYGNPVPEKWTLTGATVAKETNALYVQGQNPYVVEITSTAANGGLQYSVPANMVRMLAGRRLTVAARIYVSSGATDTAGRLNLTTSSKTSHFTRPSAEAKAGWVWKTLSLDVGNLDSSITVKIEGDAAGANGKCLVDRVILTTGSLPVDSLS